MLLEPGTAGTCRIGRLDIAAACAAELPVIVDGGVTEDIAPLCVRAGVQAMVVGRALLAPAKGVA
jgi:pentose-5-phosphate-3-epimerase